MHSAKRARHARPTHTARHARPSQAPARVAAATAFGGVLLPLGLAAPAQASGHETTAVRVSGPGHPVQPGQAPVGVRLISDGHYVSNGVVELQIPEGRGWRTIARTGTDQDGLGRTSISVARDTRVRSYYRGSSTRSAATSSSVVVEVSSWSQRLLAEAARHRGAPYQYGAVGPNAFDCSGFTRYVFGKLGKDLPHNAAAQRNMAQPIDQSQVRPGDLVFLDSSGHVGIYAGDGMMWDSPRSGKSVSLRRIYSSTFAVGRISPA